MINKETDSKGVIFLGIMILATFLILLALVWLSAYVDRITLDVNIEGEGEVAVEIERREYGQDWVSVVENETCREEQCTYKWDPRRGNSKVRLRAIDYDLNDDSGIKTTEKYSLDPEVELNEYRTLEYRTLSNLECKEKYCNLDQLLEYTLKHIDELVEVGDTVETEGRLVAVEPTPGEIRDTFNEMGQQNLSQYDTDNWATSHRLIDVEWSDAEEVIRDTEADTAIHMPEEGLPGPGTNSITIQKQSINGVETYNITYQPQEDPGHYNAPEYYRLHMPMQRAVDAGLAREFRTLIYIDETIQNPGIKEILQSTIKDLIKLVWNEEPREEEIQPTREKFDDYEHGIRVGLCPLKEDETIDDLTGDARENCERVDKRTGDPREPTILKENNKIQIIAPDLDQAIDLTEKAKESFGRGEEIEFSIQEEGLTDLEEFEGWNVTVVKNDPLLGSAEKETYSSDERTISETLRRDYDSMEATAYFE